MRILLAGAVLVAAMLTPGAALAAPGTVTGLDGLSLTVSNTTPAPGEVVTVGIRYTTRSVDVGTFANLEGFGDDIINGTRSQNLDDFTFVPGSCSGDYIACSPDPFDGRGLKGVVADATASGVVVNVGAQFLVASGASLGERISFFGYRYESDDAGTTSTGSTPMTLTVTAPGADLGVSLGATAGPLLSGTINYDVGVRNDGPAAATSATITTQLPTEATGITSASSCTYTAATHRASCPIGTLANGATTHATFAATYGLLSLGLALNATATRTASAPADPNAANDSASKSCAVVTSLVILC
ncbi:DUF11 domain-containing protein [Conexibacter woesei]|uniref:DUF11 domain-containing protein n=1 Tax=Conexibacter woesei TaxID=191495 RepID=UPI00042161FE|nr:DUF11 domain-containing protein [Conexibacter woesei]